MYIHSSKILTIQLVLPRFADLAPTSAIVWINFGIDFAFFRIDSFRFFVLVISLVLLEILGDHLLGLTRGEWPRHTRSSCMIYIVKCARVWLNAEVARFTLLYRQNFGRVYMYVRECVNTMILTYTHWYARWSKAGRNRWCVNLDISNPKPDPNPITLNPSLFERLWREKEENPEFF